MGPAPDREDAHDPDLQCDHGAGHEADREIEGKRGRQLDIMRDERSACAEDVGRRAGGDVVHGRLLRSLLSRHAHAWFANPRLAVLKTQERRGWRRHPRPRRCDGSKQGLDTRDDAASHWLWVPLITSPSSFVKGANGTTRPL